MRESSSEEYEKLVPIVFFNVADARFPSRYRFLRSPALVEGYTDTMPVMHKVSDVAFSDFEEASPESSAAAQ